MAIKKFTFRRNTEPHYPDNIAIKIGPKHEVGCIRMPHDQAYITFMVKKEPTPDDPASFKWIKLAKTFSSLEEAQEALTGENIFTALNRQYQFHKVEIHGR